MTSKRKSKQKTKSNKREEKRTEISITRFLVIYFLLMGAIFFLLGLRAIWRFVDVDDLYTKGVVVLTSRILEALSLPVTHQGSVIRLPSVALDVKFGCNGLEAVLIYAVAVLAFPAPWMHRLLGMFVGFVLLQVINILRIIALVYSALHLKSIFQYIHIYVAQGMMIAVSLGIFLIYLNYAKSSPEARV